MSRVRATYAPRPFLGLEAFRIPSVTVDFVRWEAGGKLARILVPTHPNSILGRLFGEARVPLPPPVERVVDASDISLLPTTAEVDA